MSVSTIINGVHVPVGCFFRGNHLVKHSRDQIDPRTGLREESKTVAVRAGPTDQLYQSCADTTYTHSLADTKDRLERQTQLIPRSDIFCFIASFI